jgi:hypothetical protein
LCLLVKIAVKIAAIFGGSGRIEKTLSGITLLVSDGAGWLRIVKDEELGDGG